MTRSKFYLVLQAVVCVALVLLLSLAAVDIYFDALYRAHEGDIAIIAIHSKLVTKNPVEFLADKGYAMPFATDTDDAVKDIVAGTGTLPQTVVLNRRGEVIYNKVGSVTPEVLAALYDEADASAK